MTDIITTIIAVCISFVNGLLTPIDTYIVSQIPFLSSALELVSDFFEYIENFVYFIVSWIPFTSDVWSIIISIWVFRLLVPLVFETIKLCVKWYHALMP